MAKSQTPNEALTFLESCKAKMTLTIFHWNIYDESEYTEGISFQRSFTI